jgi:Resolvase, N terminal domain
MRAWSWEAPRWCPSASCSSPSTRARPWPGPRRRRCPAPPARPPPRRSRRSRLLPDPVQDVAADVEAGSSMGANQPPAYAREAMPRWTLSHMASPGGSPSPRTRPRRRGRTRAAPARRGGTAARTRPWSPPGPCGHRVKAATWSADRLSIRLGLSAGGRMVIDTDRTDVRVMGLRREPDRVGASARDPSPDGVSLVPRGDAAGASGASEPAPVLVAPNAAGSVPAAALGLYARVSSHDQRSDLDRQLARLAEWAAKAGQPVVRVEAEVGSGMNGARSKLRRLLADPEVTVVVSSTGTGWRG